MTGKRPTGAESKPDPAHPLLRADALPWTHPKPVAEDPRSADLVAAILASAEYREADADIDFLHHDSVRGLRLQLDFHKAEELLASGGIRHCVVVFGSTRTFHDVGHILGSASVALHVTAGDGRGGSFSPVTSDRSCARS